MIWLRDLSWKLFSLTGNIEAYMLYCKHEEEEFQIDEDGQDRVEEQAVTQG
jgi:hypothetical protein